MFCDFNDISIHDPPMAAGNATSPMQKGIPEPVVRLLPPNNRVTTPLAFLDLRIQQPLGLYLRDSLQQHFDFSIPSALHRAPLLSAHQLSIILATHHVHSSLHQSFYPRLPLCARLHLQL